MKSLNLLFTFLIALSISLPADAKPKKKKRKYQPIPAQVDAGPPDAPSDPDKLSIYDPEFWQGREDSHFFDPKSKQIFWYDPATQSVYVAPVDTIPEIFSPRNGNTPPAGVVEVPEIPETPQITPLPLPPTEPTPRAPRCEGRPDRKDAQALLQSTAQISFPDGSACTAFKVSGSTVMTNNHCVVGMANSKHCFPQKNNQTYTHTPAMDRCASQALAKITGVDLKKPIEVKFVINGKSVTHKCNRIESTAAKYDYAVIRCPGMDDRIPTARISEAALRPNEPVTLATWDYGDQLGQGETKSRLESGRVVSLDDENMMASLGSQAGNSGSAIFNQDHEVVALNWGAEIKDEKSYMRARLRGHNPRGRSQFHTLQNVMKDLRVRNPKLAEEIKLASSAVAPMCGQVPTTKLTPNESGINR